MLHKVSDTKETIFGFKNKIFQPLKNGIFPKGLTHSFGQKMQSFFTNFFSLKIKLEVRVNNVLDSKKNFFVYKKEIFHSLKNGIFPKGLTHVFGPKIFTFFFFCARSKQN